MRNIGIVAEYNPFHNGHKFQIDYAKNTLGFENVVIAMSGAFTQRGEIAITGKYTRAEMALLGGADLILEIPTLFSTASAREYASAAVTLLYKTGLVSDILFGTENASENTILKISQAIVSAEATGEFDRLIQNELSNDSSYAVARAKTIEKIILSDNKIKVGTSISNLTFSDSMALKSILSTPNNILAIEYTCCILRNGYDMTIHCLNRSDNGYHSLIPHGEFASASFIRQEILIKSTNKNPHILDSTENVNKAPHILDNTENVNKNAHVLDSTENVNKNPHILDNTISDIRNYAYNCEHKNISTDIKSTEILEQDLCCGISNYAPSTTIKLLSESPLLSPDSVSLLLHERLIAEDDFTKYLDCTESISNKIINCRNDYVSFTDFIEKIKSKELSYTRVSRVLIHILLGIKKDLFTEAQASNYISYIRVLGCSENAAALLGKLTSQNTSLPIIISPQDASVPTLSDLARKVFALDEHAYSLSRILATNATRTSLPVERSRKFLKVKR